MSNVSIFEKNWIDLVFEGKNKAYGAYQLRQESSKTTTKAFFYAIGSIGLFSGIILLFSSFNTTDIITEPELTDPIIVVDLIKPPLIEEETKPEHSEAASTPIEEPLVNKPFVAVPTDEADPVDIPRNDELPTTPTPNAGGDPGTGTPVSPGSGGGGTGDEERPTAPTGPVPTGILDAQPEFPGGMKKFYNYVGDNFEKPEIDDVEALTVHVSFVIETDGSMTDIRILRNPGYSLDKEAIRVLKSLKTKWKPGILKGKPVRTQYTLPITVKLN